MSDLKSCELPYWVEKAKTGRAKCRGCFKSIAEFNLRIAELVESHWENGKMPLWYHSDCFFEEHHPKTTKDIGNFKKMNRWDREDIKQKIGLNKLSEGFKDDEDDEDDQDDNEYEDEDFEEYAYEEDVDESLVVLTMKTPAPSTSSALKK